MYLASSVAKHLEDLTERQTITVSDLDLVKCPVRLHCEPDKCSKGRDESCKKEIRIMYQYNGRKSLANLRFCYQLRGRKNEGYIGCGDRTLNMLIKRGVIDKNALICA